MKKKVFAVIAAVLLAVTTLTCGFAVSAADDDDVTIDRIVQINDYQLVLEFSKPIAINVYGLSNGPYYAIRLTDARYNLQKLNGANLQWTGLVTFADDKHDRLVFTISTDRFGCDSITEIVERAGQLGSCGSYLTTFAIEEKTVGGSNTPGVIDNITDLNGFDPLKSNNANMNGYYATFEKDFSYEIDLSKMESIRGGRVRVDVSVDTDKRPAATTGAETKDPANVGGGMPLPMSEMIVIAVCAVIVVAGIVVIIVVKGKGSKNEKDE